MAESAKKPILKFNPARADLILNLAKALKDVSCNAEIGLGPEGSQHYNGTTEALLRAIKNETERALGYFGPRSE